MSSGSATESRYGLRAGFATGQGAAERPALTLRRLMGHADIRTTLRRRRPVPQAGREHADRFAAGVRRAQRASDHAEIV
jgi:hypothetical protein